jgi:short-subunit dehydrogenase
VQLERALVTGASAGIGRAIAGDLARRGVDLVLVARDGARLEALAAELIVAHSVGVEVLVADLLSQDGRAAVESRVASLPTVDCVVNNAGMGTYGAIAASSVRAEQQQVELNVTALLRLSQVAAQTFNARRHGAILNVSSLAGFQPNPGHATYGATKAFVSSLTEAMHEELRPVGVHVTALCPGYTRTEFHERAAWDADGLPDMAWASADNVARAGIDGLLANRAIVVPGAQNKLLAGLSQLLPSAVTRRMAGMVTHMGGR